MTYPLHLYLHKREIRKGQRPNSVFQLLWEFDEAIEFGRHDYLSVSIQFKLKSGKMTQVAISHQGLKEYSVVLALWLICQLWIVEEMKTKHKQEWQAVRSLEIKLATRVVASRSLVKYRCIHLTSLIVFVYAFRLYFRLATYTL